MSDLHCKPIPNLTYRDRLYFWKYVDKSPGQGPSGECWRWTGRTNKKGYAIYRIQKKKIRKSFILHSNGKGPRETDHAALVRLAYVCQILPLEHRNG